MFIASGTKSHYHSLQQIFLRFCKTFKLDAYTVTEMELCLAVSHFVLGHSSTSAAGYLSAIQHMYDSAGAGPLPRGPKFQRFFRGLKRLFGPLDPVVRQRAITVADLTVLVKALDPANPQDCCFACQLIIAFFLALRTEDHTDGRMQWRDIFARSDGSVEFYLRPGKSTRFFRHVTIAARSDCLDLLPWLRLLHSYIPPWAAKERRPVFVSFSMSSGGRQSYPPLSRAKFVHRLKELVKSQLGHDPTLFSGYSLRRGAVTAILSADKPVAAVKRHVGWAPGSDTYNLYYDAEGRAQQLLPTAGL